MKNTLKTGDKFTLKNDKSGKVLTVKEVLSLSSMVPMVMDETGDYHHIPECQPVTSTSHV